jgi:ABC-type oligopeptide transport system substrate-binding subunit
MDRKLSFFVTVLALLALPIVTLACGDDDDDEGDSGATSEPKRGGEIVVQYAEPESFDPHWSHFAQDIGVQRMVWRGLFRLDQDNAVQPEMAASAPTISGRQDYTVKLKSG